MTTDKVQAANVRLAATAEENGGAYQEPLEYRGSSGRTMFDRPNAKDGTVTVLVPEDDIATMPRQSLVKIRSYDRKAKAVEADYIGMVVAGPFSEPDAMNADAPTLKVTAVHRAVLTPKFHGITSVEIIGVEAQRPGGGRPAVIPAHRRPAPNSPVFLLEPARIQEVLGLAVPDAQKPVRLGLMEGAGDVAVMLPANNKGVLPRHLGVLGTTGGGKSTSVSLLALQIATAGNALVMFDTEGEYAAMGDPTEDPVMLAALEERGLKPGGAADTVLYVLDGCDPAHPGHCNIVKYKLDFADISIGVLMEILDLPEAQQSRLMDAYEVCKSLMAKEGIYPVGRDEEQEALEIDELETGWKKMTLEMLIDVVSGAISHCQKSDAFGIPSQYFRGKEDAVIKAVKEKSVEGNKASWMGLSKKLWKLKRAKLFGNTRQSVIDIDRMLTAGRISIIDLSDMDAPYLRNIVIAQILRRIQSCQEEKYATRQAAKNGPPLVPVNIFIEEAHEFLSDRRIKQMPNLFEQVVRIARRGRKRHLGLVFITQLPGHLPDEVMGLINNWILHKIGDANVVQRLKKIVSGVDEGSWGSLTNLAAGHALASFTHMTRPVMVSVDPTPCKLLMVD